MNQKSKMPSNLKDISGLVVAKSKKKTLKLNAVSTTQLEELKKVLEISENGLVRLAIARLYKEII